MPRLIREILAYTKLVLVIALGLAVLTTVVMNQGRKADVWLWEAQELPTLWLMAATALVSVVLFWVLTKLRRMIVEVRQIRERRRHEREATQQRELARQLSEQERRIDAKLRKTLSSNEVEDEPARPF